MKSRILAIKLTPNRLVKAFLIVAILVFLAYLFYLNARVVGYFSQSNDVIKIQYNQQNKVAINMLLLIEDRSFFNHFGVDFKEVVRVFRDYWLQDKPLRGASTLTQQLIKNNLLTREQTMSRKLNEALMALLLELSFDKQFILNYYMNSVYLGQKGNLSINGFDQAAQFYFNKKIDDLALEEVATLVALVKGPSYYHPIKHPERLAKRKQLVLSLYHKHKKIVK
ncbi:transglycosylase domain-containing protein [Candidatus Thioglobus sp.]|uniref:transglycosylase domain-containing protein n=1 Tax=Candidatus Thioglobus sp. TaxID=2026721 RepID=UPI003D11070D